MSRETLLVQTLVEIADTLVDDFDVVDALSVLADRCVALLDVAAAGVMLVAPEGDLRVVASSSESMRVIELLELQAQEGPCLDAFRTGEPVLDQDVAHGRWTVFGPAAGGAGYCMVNAVPMCLRGEVVGALNLFRADARPFEERDVVAARALAELATVAVIQHRVARQAQVVIDQLNHALNSRVAIEQAKGVVAGRTGVGVDEAFAALRAHARSHNLLLADVARSVVTGELEVPLTGATGPESA